MIFLSSLQESVFTGKLLLHEGPTVMLGSACTANHYFTPLMSNYFRENVKGGVQKSQAY